MNYEEDLMSMDMYSYEDLIATMITKDGVHALNPRFLVENLDSYGQYIGTKDNKCRIMIGGEFDYLIFRGQNKDWDFIPSLKRTDSPIEHCINWIKKEEFKEFFKTTPFYERLPKEIGILNKDFEFDLEALAQHYEFKTNYLDITKNFNVAMFFAYTICINGKYYPINFDSANYEPYIYISSIGRLQSSFRDEFKIVGFQVSPRPLLQSAMALDLENITEPKNYFTKIELPKSNYFSVGVFNAFKKGYDLLRADILTPFVSQIKTDKIIQTHLLEKYCIEYNIEKKEVENLITDLGYEICNKPVEITKMQINEMNIYINEFILPFIANNIGYRRVVKPL